MRQAKRQQGFTIIEVLIVLAIASLILLIIFLVVPMLKRSERNYGRKEAVDYILTQMNEYYGDNGAYPLSGSASTVIDHRAGFVSGLTSSGPSSLYNIRYTTKDGDHTYPFNLDDPGTAMDEISIEPGHRCNTSPTVQPGDPDYPIESANSGDDDYHAYVIWTQLENSRVYCVDNAYGN